MFSSSSAIRARSRAPCTRARERRLHRAAALVAQHDEQRRVQVHAGVLQRAHDLGRDHVAGHANDEELAEARVEHQLGRHARIAAAEDRGVGLLALGELGEDLLLHGREARLAAHEALVAGASRASASAAETGARGFVA